MICDKIYPLGCFIGCETIEIPIQATITGSYTINIRFQKVTKTINIPVVLGENIKIDLSLLLEYHVNIFKILDGSNNTITITDMGIEYNTFYISLS